jgi:multiple sugar transport system permease protein
VQEWRTFRTAMVFLSPFTIGLIFLWLVPTILSIYFAFTDYTGTIWPPHWIGFANFSAMFDGTDPDFGTAVGVTLWWACVSVPVGLVTGLIIALMLNWNVRGIGIYRTIFFLPSLVPFVGSTLLFLWLFNPETGLVNQVLGFFHITGPGWFGDPNWSKPALLFQSVWAVGANVIIFLAGLQGIPVELHEAAALDGAGMLRRFWHVTLPLMTPVIFFNLVLGMINASQYFTQALIASLSPGSLGGGAGGGAAGFSTGEIGGPAGSTLFISLHIYDQAFQVGQVGYASAMAWMLVLVVVALTVLVMRTSRSWVHYES